MITLLTGENSFEIERALKNLVASFDGRAEKIDGSELDLKQLPDLLMGGTLFAEKRLVIIKSLSENKTLWNDFSQWIDKISGDIHLVLVEPKPDKRTKTFKELQKVAEIKTYPAWTDRDGYIAEQWAVSEAKNLGFVLDKQLARAIVRRTGINQWRLYHALEKLAVLDELSQQIIEDIIELSPTENIFQLFETALKGDGITIRRMIQTLELTEDAYQLFGLLSSQAFQLSVLAVAEKPSGEVAKDIGAHPFVLSKLSLYAKEFGRTGAKKIIAIFADADAAMKTSAGEPWLLVERALLKIAAL